jgi:GTP:adenosylcobinamide-phosphate guanylyltransferase
VVLITAREALQLHNVNTPEDYEVALQRLRTGRT